MFSNLKMFIDVVDSGSISKAAEQSHVNQSTASAQVRAIEKKLGAKLFDRANRKVYPNALGMMFYGFCVEFLEKYGTIQNKIQGQTQPNDSLSLCGSFYFNEYFLPKILLEFKENNGFVEVLFKTKISDYIIPEMENKEHDIGIIASSHAIRSQNLLTDFTYEVPVICVCSPDNHLATNGNIFPVDLSNEILFITTPGNNFHNHLKHHFKKHKLFFRKEIYLDSQDGIKASVKNDLGIAFIPEHVIIGEISRKELVEIQINGIEITRKMYAVHHVDRPLSIAAQEFIDIAAKVIDKDPYFRKVTD